MTEFSDSFISLASAPRRLASASRPPRASRRLRGAALLVLALAVTPLAAFPPAATPGGRDFEFAIRELVFRGLRGDVGALEEALARCDAALAENPDHLEALVWRGSTKIALSGVAYRGGDFAAGMQLWEAGLAEMDRAAAAGPERIEILIPRAATLLGAGGYHPVPAVSERLFRTALEDYRRVYELQRPFFEHMSPHARGELLMSLADAHFKVGERAGAAGYLREARLELAGSSYAAEAARLLALGDEPARVKTCHGCHEPAGAQR